MLPEDHESVCKAHFDCMGFTCHMPVRDELKKYWITVGSRYSEETGSFTLYINKNSVLSEISGEI